MNADQQNYIMDKIEAKEKEIYEWIDDRVETGRKGYNKNRERIEKLESLLLSQYHPPIVLNLDKPPEEGKGCENCGYGYRNAPCIPSDCWISVPTQWIPKEKPKDSDRLKREFMEEIYRLHIDIGGFESKFKRQQTEIDRLNSINDEWVHRIDNDRKIIIQQVGWKKIIEKALEYVKELQAFDKELDFSGLIEILEGK